MGLLDIFRGNSTVFTDVAPNGVPVEWRGEWYDKVLGYSVERLWETQPSLRTVISFRARNVAQLGLHTFQRQTDDGRERLRDDPAAQLISSPNPDMTTYELMYSLVAAIDLYDEAYWYVDESDATESGWEIRPVPTSWVTGTQGGTFWAADAYVISPPGKPIFTIPASKMLVFHGWSPTSGKKGTSPITALRQTLAEQMQAQEYRLQVWQRGGRAGTVITRPAGAPGWSEAAQKRFMKALKERFTGPSASEAGGPLLLQDGMTMENGRFSAKDEQFIDAAKLSIATVASVYHVNPTMIGQLDNANFSNVREFRRMLYTETLGPLLAQVQDRMNAFLVPRVTTAAGVYVEFNIGEKLRGSFEEQAAVTSTATGAPWMTRNEARKLNNLPAIDGGDELVTPLNVVLGGQASPQDGGTPPGTVSAPRPPMKRRPVLVKKRATTKQVDEIAAVFSAFFDRQKRVVLSALGAKAAGDWWDEDRWVDELADDLLAASTPLTVATARKALEQAGLDPDVYDVDRTTNYLKAVTRNTSTAVNRATKDQLDDALDDDDPSDALSNVFDVAADSRSAQAGMTLATGLASFATVEAVTQSGNGDTATKTWVVTSGNPRPAHAALNGETVPLDGTFSNGANWPGDAAALDVDDIAGCTCDVSITIP